MSPRRNLGAFLRAPTARKLLALEAGWELFCARIDTLRPARHYTRRLGQLGREAPATLSEAELALAIEIGHVVAVTARAMPFRAVCLQQVLAVRRMLARRRLGATVYLGFNRDRPAELDAVSVHTAHAWVSAGGQVINGGERLERYVVVGAFS